MCLFRYNNMLAATCIFFLAILTTSLAVITAQLTLQSYDPLLFNLHFSSPVQQPSFQLLYNNIYSIPYIIKTQQIVSNNFLIEGNITEIEADSNLQMYDVLFNSPFSVGDGQLSLDSFSLKAAKIPVTIDFPVTIGVLLLIGGYFFNIFTQLGKLLIQFIHIYVLYMFQSQMTTTMYRQLYIGTLMIPPCDILLRETYDPQMFILACMFIPPLLLLFFGVVGVMVKKWAPKERSLIWNLVYEEIVFGYLLRVSNIFGFNLVYNSIQLAILFANESYPFLNEIRTIGGLLIYFNLLTFTFLIYMKICILNPKPGQSSKQFRKYLKSEAFQDWRLLHEKMHLDIWFKRNFSLFNALKNGLIALVYFWDPLFPYLVLLIEFLHIFMIFTMMPFKEEFYLNLKVACRLLFLTSYIFIVLGDLYFSMGEWTFNYNNVSQLITARATIFLVLLFGVFIAIFVEIYYKCSSLNYQIRLVKEQNEYKLQVIQKNRTQTESSHKRFRGATLSDRRSKSSSKPIDSLSDASPHRVLMNEADLRRQLLGNSLPKKDKGKRKNNRGKSGSKVSIQMVNLHRQQREIKARQRTGSEQQGKRKKNTLHQQTLDKKE